jgi:hypothetical protein
VALKRAVFKRHMPKKKIFGSVRGRKMGTRQNTRTKCRWKDVRKRPVGKSDPGKGCF